MHNYIHQTKGDCLYGFGKCHAPRTTDRQLEAMAKAAKAQADALMAKMRGDMR